MFLIFIDLVLFSLTIFPKVIHFIFINHGSLDEVLQNILVLLKMFPINAINKAVIKGKMAKKNEKSEF